MNKVKVNLMIRRSRWTLLQAALHEFCRQGLLAKHLEVVRKQYRERRDVMVSAMRRYFPDGIHWTEPQGGLVLWVTLPQGMDARELLVEARTRGVAFNAGELFYAASPRRTSADSASLCPLR